MTVATDDEKAIAADAVSRRRVDSVECAAVFAERSPGSLFDPANEVECGYNQPVKYSIQNSTHNCLHLYTSQKI